MRPVAAGVAIGGRRLRPDGLMKSLLYEVSPADLIPARHVAARAGGGDRRPPARRRASRIDPLTALRNE